MDNSTKKSELFASKYRVFAVFAVFAFFAIFPINVFAKISERILIEKSVFSQKIAFFAENNQKSIATNKTDSMGIEINKTSENVDYFEELNNYLLNDQAPDLAKVAGFVPEDQRPDKIVKSVITVYTSTPCQTSGNPFIGASGKHVYDGMIAANWLPFGTKIKIPALYGDKVFTVDDRMNSRYGYGRLDIWLDTTKAEALKFGVKRVEVQIFYEKSEPKKVVTSK